MSWPIAVNAAAFMGGLRGRLKYENVMPMAAEIGFDGFELLFCESGTPSFDSTPSDLEHIKRISETTLPIVGVSTLLNWKYPMASTDPKIRQKAQRLMRHLVHIAQLLDCPTISISAGDLKIPGRAFKTVGKSEAFDLVVKEFQTQAISAQDVGVNLTIENALSGFIESPKDLANLLERIGMPNVSVCLDIGNAQKFDPSPIWIDMLYGKIGKVHLTDYQPTIGGKITAPGEGEVDWPAVKIALSQHPSQIMMITEHYFRREQSPLSQLEKLYEQICRCFLMTK